MRTPQGWCSLGWLAVVGLIGLLSGCAVPQQKGQGQALHRVEPETKTGYYLYLPEGYTAHKGQNPSFGRWPVVVTFHGMIPYDTAHSQIREWQEEADRYGLIVIAPQLKTCNSLMQYPLSDPELSYVRHDSRAVLMVMDKVFRETNADPGRVLATSFSCGGYLAHYFINRYPERFTCLAVRGSNFNAELLQTAQIPKYRHKPIGIYFGENDFRACAQESLEAVRWYRQFGFMVEAQEIEGLGHERRPQLAASFFARAVGLTPKTPPDLDSLVLRNVQTPDVSPLSVGGNRSSSPNPPTVLPRQSNSSWTPLEKIQPAGGDKANRGFVGKPASSPPAVQPPRPAPRTAPRTRTSSPTISTANPGATPKRPLPQPYNSMPSPEPDNLLVKPTIERW